MNKNNVVGMHYILLTFVSTFKSIHCHDPNFLSSCQNSWEKVAASRVSSIAGGFFEHQKV